MKNKCKKAASFAMSLALVAANSAITMSNSSTIVAKAAEANAQVNGTTVIDTVSPEQGSDESYFDAETQTLHLKGNVRNSTDGTGVILPSGVYCDEIFYVVADEGTVLPENCSCFFKSLNYLWSIDLKNADTSNVTDMSYMFSREDNENIVPCEIDFTGFDTSNVTSMEGMFVLRYTEELDLTSFDTSKVTDMSGMFCDSVWTHSIDVSSFDTSNVTDMSSMFFNCRYLESLDLSSFDTSNVKDMNNMFAYSNLKALDLNNFKTQNVTDMSFMFEGCVDFEELDLSNFDTSKVMDMTLMFWRCSSLKTIYVSDKWSTEGLLIGNGTNYNESIFSLCENLVGGSGTVFDEKHTDAEYARIDGGKDAPGYFTAVRNDAEEETTDDNAIPEEVMDTINYLYSNINDPTLKSVADSAIRLFNRFFSFR